MDASAGSFEEPSEAAFAEAFARFKKEIITNLSEARDFILDVVIAQSIYIKIILKFFIDNNLHTTRNAKKERQIWW